MSFIDWFRRKDSRRVTRTAEAPAARLEALEPRLMLDGAIEPVVPMAIDYIGASLPSWWFTSYQVTGAAAMTALADTGANVVALTPTWYQDTVQSDTIFPHTLKTANDTGLASMITQAHNDGLAVVLKPHVDVWSGAWRGTIAPGDVDAWFASYQNFIVHYAEIAQAGGAEFLVVGTELAGLSGAAHLAAWQGVIDAVEAVYNGELIYAANHDEYANVSFWGEVDTIGVNAYFDLGQGAPAAGASYDDILGAWDEYVTALTDWRTANRPGQDVMFTEIGYRSITGAHIRPWESSRAGAVNQQAQADCYRAALETWHDVSWLDGMLWWTWPVDLAQDVGGDDATTGYSPSGKAAEAALRQYASRLDLPDLIVSSTTADRTTVLAGQTITVQVTTTNVGDGLAAPDPAGVLTTGLYLSDALDFGPGAPLAGEQGTEDYTHLHPGESQTATFTITAPTAPGKYYLAAMADTTTVVAEKNRENNNWGTFVEINVQEAPVVTAPIANVAVDANAAPTGINLWNHFDDPDVTGSTYQFVCSLGTFVIHFFDAATPITVANFIAYADAGDYVNTFVHRSVPGFIIQFGGYTFTDLAGLLDIISRGEITNEPGISNRRGTIAMAKIADQPNSATSEAFVNLADNSANLDAQNQGFTAFGEVLCDGMTVLDRIAAVQRWNAGGVFTDLPLIGFTGQGDIAQQHLVSFQSITRVAELSFEVVGNTNPSLVAPTINAAGGLVLTYARGVGGTARITVRATDLCGATVQTSFNVTVTAPAPGLTVQFVNVGLPAPAGGGHMGLVQLRLGNGGNGAAIGMMGVELWASGDGDLATPGDDYLISTVNAYAYVQPGGTGGVYAFVTVPGTIPAGVYDLVAVVDTGNAIAEHNETNNTAVLPGGFEMANPDLTAGFAAISLQASTIAGATGTARLTMTNAGQVIARGRADVQLWATADGDVTDGVGDYLLTTLAGQYVYLQPGASMTYYASFALPPGMAAGDYRLLVVADSGNDIAESDETNNTALSAGQYQVREAFVDLAGTFGNVWLANAVLAGQRLFGFVPINVANLGNVALPAGQRLDIALVARETTTNAEVVLANLTNQYAASLGAGATRPFFAMVMLNNGLPAGQYELRADIVPQGGLVESDATNNAVTLDGDGNPVGITAAPAFVDLEAGLGNATLPAQVVSGDGTRIYLPVTATNRGNVSVPLGTVITVEVHARKAGSPDVQVAVAANQSIAYLGAGFARSFYISVLLPAGMDAGQYQLVGKVDTTDALAESDETNNAAATAQTIDVQRGWVDLTGRFGRRLLADQVTAGQTLFALIPINITNLGNVALPLLQQVDITISIRDTTTNVETVLITLTNQYLIGLGAGATRQLWAFAYLPAGIPAGTYDLLADITPLGGLTEESAANNRVEVDEGGDPVTVTAVP